MEPIQLFVTIFGFYISFFYKISGTSVGRSAISRKKDIKTKGFPLPFGLKTKQVAKSYL